MCSQEIGEFVNRGVWMRSGAPISDKISSICNERRLEQSRSLSTGIADNDRPKAFQHCGKYDSSRISVDTRTKQ